MIAHEEKKANNAILSFQRNHPFLRFTLDELVENFDSKMWGNQGPQRVTACIYKYCDFNPKSILEGEYCNPKDNKTSSGGGFSVLHHSTGYAIPFGEWHKFFDKGKADNVQDKIESSFAIHYWNYMRKMSKKGILMDPKQPLYTIFKANCPTTEEHLLKNLIGSLY